MKVTGVRIKGKPRPDLKTLDDVLKVAAKDLWKEIQAARRKRKRRMKK